MRKKPMVLVGAALVAAAVCLPREALALGPVDLEIGAKVGGGTNLFNDPTPNPLGFGIGARAGVSFLGLYGGLQFMYYLGSTQNVAGFDFSEKAFNYGIEGGYGVSLMKFFTLRGQVGLGNMQFQTSVSQNTPGPVPFGGNSGHLYVEPGATLLLSIATVFVGVDANALIVPDAPHPAFTAHGQVGMTF